MDFLILRGLLEDLLRFFDAFNLIFVIDWFNNNGFKKFEFLMKLQPLFTFVEF